MSIYDRKKEVATHLDTGVFCKGERVDVQGPREGELRSNPWLSCLY